MARMGIQAIEGTTWDIFFGSRERVFVSFESGNSINADGIFGRSITQHSEMVSFEFFEIPESDEMMFSAGIKRWIASVEFPNGPMDWVRFTPGEMTVKVEIFQEKR